jgi:hypothetical protein
MDMVQIITCLLPLLCVAGIAYYLLQHRVQPQRPVPNLRRSEIAQDLGLESEIQQDFARVFCMMSAQGKEPDQALAGLERLRPNGSHAAYDGRVAAG